MSAVIAAEDSQLPLFALSCHPCHAAASEEQVAEEKQAMVSGPKFESYLEEDESYGFLPL